MNTMEGLRATLAEHADIADTAMVGRSASVHHRIQAVRRRRRAAAALGTVGAVLALIAGVGLTSALHDRGVRHLPAATTLTVNGFQYRLVRVAQTEPGQRRLDLATPPPGSREAFALVASGLHGGTATLRSNNVENHDVVDQIVRDGTNPPVAVVTPYLVAGTPGPYRLTLVGGDARTRVGVAIYERTSAMPAGVVDPTGHAVFRQVVGSQRLLAAAFAKPGRASVTFRFSGRLDQVKLGGFCAWRSGIDSFPEGAAHYVNVSIDGGAAVSSDTCLPATEDAWSGGFVSHDTKSGEHTVRVWTSATARGPAKRNDHVVLGGAAYDDSSAVTIDGSRVEPVVEFGGRTWRLDRSALVSNTVAARSITATAPRGSSVLYGYAATNVSRLSVAPHRTVGGIGGSREGVGPVSSVGTIGLAGGSSYTVSWPAKDTHAEVSILVYRLVS